MELNSKKLERTSKIVYYTISVILCLFLILLSNNIIEDLDKTIQSPQLESFENKIVITELYKEVDKQNVEIENLNGKKETVEKTIATAKDNCANEKQSFDNWLETRKTLGSPDKDKEVIDRAKKLDEFYKVEQAWRVQLDSLQTKMDEAAQKNIETQELITEEQYKAETKYFAELKQYDLKVFLIRLLFVAPILALGIFFFVRYRKNKFWPLYFGFTLFSVYAFFIGLVQYLPSYGGYVRYTVGIALTAGLGFYAIKRIRQFVEQKQAELKISTHERAKKVHGETAQKALDNHFCPSCGKDFMLRKWEFPLPKNLEAEAYRLVTDYCRYCGLQLFKNCSSCGNKNFAHLPFCSSCGADMATEK